MVNVYVTGSRRRQQYTDANYNGILREIQAMKEAGDSSAVKINQLVCKTNENKEEKMMESHKKAWKKMNFELESKVPQLGHGRGRVGCAVCDSATICE